MLTWPHLRAIAEPVWLAYRQLCTEKGELLAGRLRQPTRAVAGTLALSERLAVAFHDRPFVRRAKGTAIEVEYDAVAEVTRRTDGRRVVAFHFTTTWPKPAPSVARPEDRVAAQRELRKIESALREIVAAFPRPDKQARREITERALPLMRRYNALHAALWPHRLRTSPRVKGAQWKWRSGQTELASHGLGPIVLTPATTLDEACLKMALLSARHDALDPEALDPVLRAVQNFLGTDHERAAEVFSSATMGYVGDLSPGSFRSYLRKVLRSLVHAKRGLGRARADDEAETDGGLRAFHGRRRASRAGEPDGRQQRVKVRLPSDAPGAHPWAGGSPALLSRLGVDYEIPPAVVRSWWRAGKITARGCPFREERTTNPDLKINRR